MAMEGYQRTPSHADAETLEDGFTYIGLERWEVLLHSHTKVF
jgi:hypothetical protein